MKRNLPKEFAGNAGSRGLVGYEVKETGELFTYFERHSEKGREEGYSGVRLDEVNGFGEKLLWENITSNPKLRSLILSDIKKHFDTKAKNASDSIIDTI
jgi:hypothetical protein